MQKPISTILLGTLTGTGIMVSFATCGSEEKKDQRPNVIIVLTDDQGYGDLSCHGNPVLRTPHIDRVHAQSVRLLDFHVAPMCSPTRGQLMTGQDALRNRSFAVSGGHQFPKRDLPTMADMFSAANYATGIFGKWHLGHTYPYRPQDRGFQEVMTFYNWGMAGISELLNDYTDGTFVHNGERKPFKGYATDFWFDEAMDWMKLQAETGKPFFSYISTHTPHRPNWTDAKTFAPYAELGAGLGGFYAMVANIDDNVGRLEEFLEREGLDENTILIFMTDNGSTYGAQRYNSGMRGGKTSLYEGGHRVPFFIRWPAVKLGGGRDVAGLTHVQDVMPTLAALIGIEDHLPGNLDGIDLTMALREKGDVPDRKLVVQYNTPAKNNACVMWGPWRLVDGKDGKELYQIDEDPGQETNVIHRHPRIVEEMTAFYEEWWTEATKGVKDTEPLVIAPSKQNPVLLTGSELHGIGAGTNVVLRPNRYGSWLVDVEEAGIYRIRLGRWPLDSGLSLDAPLEGYRHTGGYRAWPEDWHLILQALPQDLADQLHALPPAGKAFPVHQARMTMGSHDLLTTDLEGAPYAEFVVQLETGRQTLHAWFEDADSNRLVQAFYVEFYFLR